MPKIRNLIWGELDYIPCGEQEPVIEDDRVSLTASLRFSEKITKEDIVLRFIDDNGQETIISPINADNKAKSSNSEKGKFFHFRLETLTCKTLYQYEILYKGKVLPLNKTEKPACFRTPPARQDPQPIKIAAGGDQERHEQLGALGRLFDLDNHKDTKKLYQHIGSSGTGLQLDDPVEEQPYEVFFHLGDLFNGENTELNDFTCHVTTLKAFRHHIKTDFSKPVGNHLSQVSYGFYAAAEDHDIGQNNGSVPKTPKEIEARENMQSAFHEAVLMPKFLEQTSDGYGDVTTVGGRAGPYYKKRIGQSEFFILHNRYTQDPDNARAYLLGEAQWSWLEESLSSSKASNRIIISPLPLVMGKAPNEDYRAHWQEWDRMMQLCRKYKISTILTADSHNYSFSEIHVHEEAGDEPWIVYHQLIGTLGGSKQSISDEELAEINKPGRPPLLPKGEGFNASLYDGSTVKAYFSPGDDFALLPNGQGGSRWTTKKEWSKDTHGYAGIICSPSFTPSETLEENTELVSMQKKPQTMPWQFRSCLFTCSKQKPEVTADTRLYFEYGG